MTAGMLRILRRRHLPIALAIIGIWATSRVTALAIEPLHGPIDFERADLPADLPEAWPKDIDQMVKIPRQKFISLIEKLNRGPRSAWLKSAHYEATLVNDTLQDGLMTASVHRLKGNSALLDLGDFSFAVEDLKWQDRPAVWGTTDDGRVWLVADRTNGELLGEWSCRGRKFPGGIDFDLELPQATSTFLDLRVPQGYLVEASSAEVTLLPNNPNEETRLWRVHCGNERRCRIVMMTRDGLDTSGKALMVDHEMQVVVREEDLRFQLNLYLEALDTPIQELTLKVPTGVEFYSAFYGVDTPVPLRQTAEMKSDGRISIRLPGPLLPGPTTSRRRTLRIEGSADQKPGQPTIVPNIIVENGTFDGGKLAVTIQSPLQVRSFRASGYRQRTTDAESYTFQQLTSDAQLILDVYRTPVALSGESISLLEIDEDSWNLTTEIAWNSLAGRAYQVGCIIPAKWEIIDVQLVGDLDKSRKDSQKDDPLRSRDVPKLNWDVQLQSDGTSILGIEFLDPIQVGRARVIKFLARRRAPNAGQPVPIPMPQLVNCDSSERFLGIQLPASVSATVSPDCRLERVSGPTSNVLSIPSGKSDADWRWYRGDSLDVMGTLELRPRLMPIHAKTETTVEAFPTEYRLKYSIQYDHRESQVDRMLVYLTEPSTDVRWTWKGPQTLDLSAVRLAKSQHVEWNMPSKGELWEIRLPRTIGSSVSLEGLATNRWSVSNRPPLAFVPQAVDKISELRLVQPESLELTIETDGLKPFGQHGSWFYSTPQAELGLSLRNPEPSREFPLMVSMQLRTLMSASSEGFDVYRARMQLENGSALETLRVKLDPSAAIQEAHVDGEAIVLTLQGGEYVIPGLNAARKDIVELIYRVPVNANPLFERRKIAVPQVSAKVLGFFWEFGIPPSIQIFAEPDGVRLTREIPPPKWSERLFGPLGRKTNELIFNPLRINSWSQFFHPQQLENTTIGNSDGDLVSLQQAVAPDAPKELCVELWHAERVTLLTWISFCLVLVIGIILRMIRWNYRDQASAYWLAIIVAIGTVATPPYVSFLGAAIAGTLIALLIPHHLLQKKQTVEESAKQSGELLQSTVIASVLIAIAFLGARSTGGQSLFAQETTREESGTNKRPIVYVPVDEDGEPSESRPWVHVPADAMARWEEMASHQAPEPRYLISSAQYQCTGMSDGNFELIAKFRAHIVGLEKLPVTIGLGLPEVSLPDANSCRLNGIPHPIVALPNNRGYAIEISSSVSKDVDAFERTNHSQIEEAITTFEIELTSRMPRPQSSNLELHIPKVANSHVEFSLPQAAAVIEIIGSRGTTQRFSDNRSVASDIGSTSSIELRWGASATPQKLVKINASLLQHLELHSAYAELFFHLGAVVTDGSLNTLEFEVPQNAVIRKIQAHTDTPQKTDILLRSDVVITRDGRRRIRLVFDKPQKSPFSVNGTLIVNQSDSLDQTRLPKFELVPSNAQYVINRNWWGVSTSADFRIETPNLDPENVNTISSDAYLNAWDEAIDQRHLESIIPRQPQFTFELHGGTIPTFKLMLQQSRRRVTQWKQTAVIGKRRLGWTLVGEIETTQAPTFQSVLLVDRRLRIENISVKENGAERLARRTESRSETNRVVLFLSDKTQGRQQITVQGSLPLIPGVPITLPFVRAEDCEMIESQLKLYSDPEVEVTFDQPAEWKLSQSDDSPSTTLDVPNSVLLGAFQIPDLPTRAAIQTSSRHSRCRSRAAVLLSRTENLGWMLKYRMEMTPEGESPLRMGLKFPSEFAVIDAVTIDRAEPFWHKIENGERQLDLLLNRGETFGSVVIQLEMPISEPKQHDWKLPLPIPMNSSDQETLLFVDHDNVWFPTNGQEVRVEDLPEWASEFFKELPGTGSAFRISEDEIDIQRDFAKSDSHESSIRLLDQRMWVNENGQSSGVTQAFLSSVRNDLVFEIPPNMTMESIFLDDRPMALSATSDCRLVIPITEVRAESLLTISWTFDHFNFGFHKLAKECLLWPRDIRVDRNLINVLPENPKWSGYRTGLYESSSLDQSLDRLETLLERQSALGDETRAAFANRSLIHQRQTRLVSRLSFELERSSDVVNGRLKRWSRITEAISKLDPFPASASISWHARLLEGPVGDSDVAVRSQDQNIDTLEFWYLNRRMILLACAMLTGLILIPIFRRLIRIEWSAWLHEHITISWLLFAIFWWLFLTPSALGPFLMIFGIFKTTSKPKSPETIATTDAAS